MDRDLLMLMSNAGLEYLVYNETRDEILAAFFYQDHAVEYWKARAFDGIRKEWPDNPNTPRFVRIDCDPEAEDPSQLVVLEDLDDLGRRIDSLPF
jgi:hypothetical protein